MTARADSVILNGFDRSGTSVIARTLARHPSVELIMQPFNSGSVRRKLYQVFDDSIADESDINFFEELQRGKLETSYIASEWHRRYSTVTELQPGQLHVLKTTLNHFTARWMRDRFPGLELWGVWRDPLDVLASLVRNDFHTAWFSGALEELSPTVAGCPLLDQMFSRFLPRLDNQVRVTAFVIVVRSYFFFHYLERGRFTSYEAFIDNENEAFLPLLEHFGLPPHDFGNTEEQDMNIIGRPYEPRRCHREVLTPEDLELAEELFAPLHELVEEHRSVQRRRDETSPGERA